MQAMGVVSVSHQLSRCPLPIWKQLANRLLQQGKPSRGQGHAHD